MKLHTMTLKELYKIAQDKNVPNRSKMKKDDLIKALSPFFQTQAEKALNFLKTRKQSNVSNVNKLLKSGRFA